MRKGVLSAAMGALVKDARRLVKEKIAGQNADPHQSVCHELAEQYHLWDDRDRFPRWLSRVVEGVMRDVEAGDDEE